LNKEIRVSITLEDEQAHTSRCQPVLGDGIYAIPQRYRIDRRLCMPCEPGGEVPSERKAKDGNSSGLVRAKGLGVLE
jgi:hypothetical protein